MQVHSKKNLSSIIFIYLLGILMLSSSYAVENNTQKKSSLDIQQIQTKVYIGLYADLLVEIIGLALYSWTYVILSLSRVSS